MTNLSHWLNEYQKSHQNKMNKLIHKFCVPLIIWSILAMLWVISIPLGDFFTDMSLNASLILTMLVLSYYFTLSPKLAVGMTLVTIPMLVLCHFLHAEGLPLFCIAAGVFALAWIGQFIGHKFEGKKPAFFQDLVFLLIGPLWVLKSFMK